MQWSRQNVPNSERERATVFGDDPITEPHLAVDRLAAIIHPRSGAVKAAHAPVKFEGIHDDAGSPASRCAAHLGRQRSSVAVGGNHCAPPNGARA
jgi:hypothetical protein